MGMVPFQAGTVAQGRSKPGQPMAVPPSFRPDLCRAFSRAPSSSSQGRRTRPVEGARNTTMGCSRPSHARRLCPLARDGQRGLSRLTVATTGEAIPSRLRRPETPPQPGVPPNGNGGEARRHRRRQRPTQPNQPLPDPAEIARADCRSGRRVGRQIDGSRGAAALREVGATGGGAGWAGCYGPSAGEVTCLAREEWQQQARLVEPLAKWLDPATSFATATDPVVGSVTSGAMRRERGMAPVSRTVWFAIADSVSPLN